MILGSRAVVPHQDLTNPLCSPDPDKAADPGAWGDLRSASGAASTRRTGACWGRPGTVVAAECCFGAQLYAPSRTHDRRAVCYAYLDGGAYGYFGSSTIAYGPSTTNGKADLICRYFLEEVLRGSSLGRAALEARQKY